MCGGVCQRLLLFGFCLFEASTAILGSLLGAGATGSVYPGFDEVGGVC